MFPFSINTNNNNINHQTAAAAAAAVGEKDVISIHSMLVLGGYGGCLVSAGFTICLVFASPGPLNSAGALRYISEGIDAHCGYANVVMGTCSLLILLCQLAAAVHMGQHNLLFACAVGQTLGWNVVLGVQDTGWTVHYIGLMLFLFGNLYYHLLASRDAEYGGRIYCLVNALTWLFGFVFVCIAGASIVMGNNDTVLRSFAVAFEFVLMLFLAVQNACIVHALDQFRDIRLRFDRY